MTKQNSNTQASSTFAKKNGRFIKEFEEGRKATEQLKSPGLSRRQRRRLERMVENGERAFMALLETNKGLVCTYAEKYATCGTAYYEDLVASGESGFVRAVETFDPAKGAFPTWASRWIRKEILKQVYFQKDTVHIPEKKRLDAKKLDHAHEELRMRLGREPLVSEVAAHVGFSEDDVAELGVLAHRAANPIRLDATVDEDSDECFMDSVLDEEAIPLVESVYRGDLTDALNSKLSELDERTVRMLADLFGLFGHEVRTHKAVAESEGISQGRVSQMKREAIEGLHDGLKADGWIGPEF